MPRLQALGLVLLVAVSACSSDNTYLPALLDDPMASYQADGLVLIESWEQPEKASGFMGKPQHAQVERLYRIDEASQVDELVVEIVSFAEESGWLIREPRAGASPYRGSKQLAESTGRLSIGFAPVDRSNSDGPWHLRIFLDFGPVRFDDTTTTTEGV